MRAPLAYAISLFIASTLGCSGEPQTSEGTTTSAATSAKKPSDPVAADESIRVKLTRTGGDLERVYVPLTVNGRAEHVILDSGTARTWIRLPNATQDFTPGAFVGTLGDTVLSIFGRNVPPFNEIVSSRVVIGTIGIDWLGAGPTELDLRNGTLVRHPVGFRVPGAETWPVLRVEQTRGVIHGHIDVDGVDHHVLVDTGAPTTLLIAQPNPGDAPRTSHDALGNPFTVYDGHGRVTAAPGLGAVDATVTRAPTFPHLEDIANAIGLPIDGLLGLSSMGEGRVLFDLAVGELRFEPR